MSPSERDEIIALVTRLQEQIAELMAANEELRRQLAESHRSGRRQAAPFSKGKRSSKSQMTPEHRPPTPSILGRDLLRRGRIVVDDVANQVLLDLHDDAEIQQVRVAFWVARYGLHH